LNEISTFASSLANPELGDLENDGIVDSLNREVAEKQADGLANDYINVTVMLKSARVAVASYFVTNCANIPAFGSNSNKA
jgi:hypothetical protein